MSKQKNENRGRDAHTEKPGQQPDRSRSNLGSNSGKSGQHLDKDRTHQSSQNSDEDDKTRDHKNDYRK